MCSHNFNYCQVKRPQQQQDPMQWTPVFLIHSSLYVIRQIYTVMVSQIFVNYLQSSSSLSSQSVPSKIMRRSRNVLPAEHSVGILSENIRFHNEPCVVNYQSQSIHHAQTCRYVTAHNSTWRSHGISQHYRAILTMDTNQYTFTDALPHFKVENINPLQYLQYWIVLLLNMHQHK